MHKVHQDTPQAQDLVGVLFVCLVHVRLPLKGVD